MKNPILARLKALVDEGLHPHAILVRFHPYGSVMKTTMGDWISMAEGGGLPKDLPPGVTASRSMERYPDDVFRLPEASWEEVEVWVHEAAWMSKAIDYARTEYGDELPRRDIEAIWGEYADIGMEMNGRMLSWLFKPNAWMHPRLPAAIRRYRDLQRHRDDMPEAPLIPRRKNGMIVFDLPRR